MTQSCPSPPVRQLTTSPIRPYVNLGPTFCLPSGESSRTKVQNVLLHSTGIPVRLVSDADGEGGIEFFDYDLKARKAFVKRIGFKGETKSEQSLD